MDRIIEILGDGKPPAIVGYLNGFWRRFANVEKLRRIEAIIS